MRVELTILTNDLDEATCEALAGYFQASTLMVLPMRSLPTITGPIVKIQERLADGTTVRRAGPRRLWSPEAKARVWTPERRQKLAERNRERRRTRVREEG